MELNSTINTEKSNNALPAGNNDEFKKVVDESKAAIAGTTVEPRKRSRGRPAKVTETTQQAAPASVAMTPPPDISAMLETPLIALSLIPARRHNIPELALSPDEAKAAAAALNQILQAFVPDLNTMSPKTAAVVMGVATFGAIGFNKYVIYSEKSGARMQSQVFNQKTNVEKPVESVESETAPNPENQVEAQSYFRKN